MTFSFFGRTRARETATLMHAHALAKHPVKPTLASMSVVVPVRDNAAGISRIVRWWCAHSSEQRPHELIVVDDGSRRPVTVEAPNCRVLRTIRSGPAAARNRGWRATTSEWVCFIDSDCVPDDGWPMNFERSWNGELAIQGRIRPFGHGALSRFYDSQGILSPMSWTADNRPRYLITANVLVWREALEAIGGFDESFRLAAGEDVDLGLRLASIGTMRWCAEASVAHEFDESLISFIKRFVRYGRGNRTLAARVDETLQRHFRPRPFRARSGRLRDHALASLAFGCLAFGWLMEARESE